MPFEEVMVVCCDSMTQMQIFEVTAADSIIIITGAHMFKMSHNNLKILSARRWYEASPTLATH
jgi:hypothetical protein